MKRLLLTTALLCATAGAGWAQDAAPLFREAGDATELRASDFIGMRVYASETTLDADEYAGAQDGWSDIGEINDVILTRDGAAAAVLVDIGGFLGMGERQVAVDMSAIRFVSDGSTADNAADFFLVMNAARADFEAAPDYSMAMPADAEGVATDTADPMADGAVAGIAETDMTADAPVREPVMRDGFVAAPREALTAEMLTGATVYGSDDTVIGEVGELILTGDGQIVEAVIDVGGFLGMGEKPVALKLADIDILRNEAGDDLRVYVSMTKDQLEQMPNYGG